MVAFILFANKENGSDEPILFWPLVVEQYPHLSDISFLNLNLEFDTVCCQGCGAAKQVYLS